MTKEQNIFERYCKRYEELKKRHENELADAHRFYESDKTEIKSTLLGLLKSELGLSGVIGKEVHPYILSYSVIGGVKAHINESGQVRIEWREGFCSDIPASQEFRKFYKENRRICC